MSISYEHSIDVTNSPEQAFALLDDLPQTPQWLAPCTANAMSSLKAMLDGEKK